MSQEAHIGQMLPLSGQPRPISNNTTFYSGYDGTAWGYTNQGAVKPFGHAWGPSFSGNGAYVNTYWGNGYAIPTAPAYGLNIEVWAKPSSIGSNICLFSAPAGTNQRLYVSIVSGKWDMGIQGSAESTPVGTTSATAEWTHVCLQFNNGTASLYINGIFSFSKTYTAYSLAGDMIIGCLPGGVNPWQGTISEFRVWPNNRTQSDIMLSMFQEPAAGTSLLSWLRMNENTAVPVAEVASLAISSAPTSAGNVTVTLDAVATNVAVTSGVAQVESLTTTATATASGNVIVTLDTVATNVAVIGGTAEVASLQITNATGATTAGNVTVTLDGVATTVALVTTDNTPALVATKIRGTAFAGWTTGGATDTVTFTATTMGNKTDATYSAGTTGAAGTMTTPTQGVAADTATDVATKIRAATYSGWTTGGTTTNVTFTSNTKIARTSATYSAGTTGAAGTMTTTATGIAPDTATDAATKIRNIAFAGWTTGGTTTTITFTATATGSKVDAVYSAGTTGTTGTMTTTTQGVSTNAGAVAQTSSISGSDGSYVGSIAWATGCLNASINMPGGKFGGAISIPTVGPSLRYPSSVLNAAAGTISFWAQMQSNPSTWDVSSTDGYYFCYNENYTSGSVLKNAFALVRKAKSATTLSLVITDAASTPNVYQKDIVLAYDALWHHYAITWSKAANLVNIYIDGVLLSSQAPTYWFVSLQNTPIFAVGSYYREAGTTGSSNLLIDELRIDSVAITADEITSWYYANAPFVAPETTKLSY